MESFNSLATTANNSTQEQLGGIEAELVGAVQQARRHPLPSSDVVRDLQRELRLLREQRMRLLQRDGFARLANARPDTSDDRDLLAAMPWRQTRH